MLPQIFLTFAQGLSYDLSKFSAKMKKSEATFVAMNMTNKCAKFHKDSPNGKKVKFNLLSAIEFSETADFVYNFI